MTIGRYEVATPGSSRRLRWRVVYVYGTGDRPAFAGTHRERYDRSGNRVIGYGSRDAAARIANELNGDSAIPMCGF